MLVSLNTNTVAMRTLQDLNANQARMTEIQKRLNTGKIVASAKDNGAVFGMAQTQRGDLQVTQRVIQSVDRGLSTADVAIAAAETISDLLLQMKEKALSASDVSLDSTSRAAMNEDFKALRDQISKTITAANFNGANLINGSLSAGFVAVANENGSTITIKGENLSLGGSIITLAATASLGTASLSSASISTVESSISNLSAALTRLGTDRAGFDRHKQLMSDIMDAIEGGISHLVDADMAKESARMQAEQVRVQLNTQNLAFANQQPQGILQLFGR